MLEIPKKIQKQELEIKEKEDQLHKKITEKVRNDIELEISNAKIKGYKSLSK